MDLFIYLLRLNMKIAIKKKKDSNGGVCEGVWRHFAWLKLYKNKSKKGQELCGESDREEEKSVRGCGGEWMEVVEDDGDSYCYEEHFVCYF